MAWIGSKKITIDHTKCGSGNSSNFPVLFYGTYTGAGSDPDLRSVGNGGSIQNSNGYDIYFYSDSALTTRIPAERVGYNASTGAVEYWVKIPTVSASVDTDFYIAYGDSGISTDPNSDGTYGKTSVWDSNYKGVWHLGNGTTLSATDSTSNGGNGTIATPTATTGKIGGGANFNGTSDIITVTGKMGSPTTMTLQAWVNKNSGTDGVKGGVVNVAGGVYMRADWNQGYGFRCGYYGSGQGNDIFTGSSISGTGWHLVSLVINPGSSSQILYNDGVSLGTSSNNYSIDYSRASDTIIGSAAGVYFAGIIDEVRVSISVRSADWITTEYNNQSSPSTFYTISNNGGVDITVSPAVKSLTFSIPSYSVSSSVSISPAVKSLVFSIPAYSVKTLFVEVLVVGGGGSAGGQSGNAGGGGAGGEVQYNSSFEITAQPYSVTIGAGGAGVTNTDGNNGGDSIFGSITAHGGGGGSRNGVGLNGGNGGGAGTIVSAVNAGGTGTSGRNGGSSGSASGGSGGGGAGAGADGQNGGARGAGLGGNGGDGVAYSISGSSVYYGGGGGGAGQSSGGGSGGLGGGGASTGSGVAGTANTGGGGGANSATGQTTPSGGSGVVIISYVTADFSGYVITGGTITTNGSKTVHTFNSSGTFDVALKISPNVLSATFSIPSYTISNSVSVSPSVKSAVFSIPTYSVISSVSISAPVNTATFSIPTYTVIAGDVNISVPVQVATFSIPIYSVSTGQNVSISPSVQVVTFSIPSYNISTTRSVSISSSVFSLIFSIPSLRVVSDFWSDKFTSPTTSWSDNNSIPNTSWSNKY